ncbi:12472_t:CDS:2, partial [Racocetra fulgida]
NEERFIKEKRRYHEDESIESSNSGTTLKRSDTENLIEFLKNDNEFRELKISDDGFSHLHDEEITGQSFIKLKKKGPSTLRIKDWALDRVIFDFCGRYSIAVAIT